MSSRQILLALCLSCSHHDEHQQKATVKRSVCGGFRLNDGHQLQNPDQHQQETTTHLNGCLPKRGFIR